MAREKKKPYAMRSRTSKAFNAPAVYGKQRAPAAGDAARNASLAQFRAERHPSHPSQDRFYNRLKPPPVAVPLDQKAAADVLVGAQQTPMTPEQQILQASQFASIAKTPPPEVTEPERVSYARVKPQSAATRKRLSETGRYEQSPGGYLQHESSNIPARTPREMLSKFPVPTSENRAMAMAKFDEMNEPYELAKRLETTEIGNRAVLNKRMGGETPGIVQASHNETKRPPKKTEPETAELFQSTNRAMTTGDVLKSVGKPVAEMFDPGDTQIARKNDPIFSSGEMAAAKMAVKRGLPPATATKLPPATGQVAERSLLGNQPVSAAELPSEPPLGPAYDNIDYGLEIGKKRKKEAQASIIQRLQSFLESLRKTGFQRSPRS